MWYKVKDKPLPSKEIFDLIEKRWIAYKDTFEYKIIHSCGYWGGNLVHYSIDGNMIQLRERCIIAWKKSDELPEEYKNVGGKM